MKLDSLLKYNNIVIQMHDNPDADAVGSAYALYKFFLDNNKQARIIYGGKFEITKSNMLLMIKELGIPVEYVSVLEKPELLLTVDCQYGEGNVTCFEADNIAIIDHHNTGRESNDYSEIRSHIVSCATVCYDMLREAGYDVNKDRSVATALYYGMYMDSNELSELRHPLERDMVDYLKIDKVLINRLAHSNFTLLELETAGIALLRFTYDESKKLSIIHSKPCDPNILGVIGDIVLKVDTIDVSVIFNECSNGYKLSLRSCVPEIGVNHLAAFLTEGIGNGGGHLNKAGGFISRKQLIANYGDISIETYLFSKINEYYNMFDVIHSKNGITDKKGYNTYSKLPYKYGYVKSLDMLENEEECRIRTLEGDVFVTGSENTYIMIGFYGEVYPINKDVFEKRYVPSTNKLVKEFEYAPSVLKLKDNKICDIMPYAYECFAVPGNTLMAKELKKPTKLFSKWDYEKYMYGEVGDYICYNSNDEFDTYIIKKEVFEKTYQKV